MAPLTDFRDTTKCEPLGESSLDLASGVVAFAGGIACTDTASGYGVQGQTKTGLVARGIFKDTVDNSAGGNGAKSVNVEGGCFWVDNDASLPCRRADIDLSCFIVDDHTVARTDGGGTRSVAGIIRGVGTKGVLVEFGSVNGAALVAEIAAREALEANLADQDTLAGVLTGKSVANVADANVIGGIPVVHRIAVADGATGDVDVVLTDKTMVDSVKVIKTSGAGGAGDTITVKNSANAITDAIDINVADKVTKTEGTIDDAYNTIAAGGTLRITRTKASAANVACIVIVKGMRVA